MDAHYINITNCKKYTCDAIRLAYHTNCKIPIIKQYVNNKYIKYKYITFTLIIIYDKKPII